MTSYAYDIIPDGGSKCFSVSGAGDISISDANWNYEPTSGDWLWCGWVKLTNKTNTQTIVGKYAGGGNQRSYLIFYDVSTDRFTLTVCTDGTAAGNHNLADSVLGSPSTGVWYFLEAGRVSGSLSIRITPASSGSRNSATTGTGFNVFNGTANLALGAFHDSGSSPFYFTPLSGQMDQWMYWQGTLPSSGNLDSIFNGGSGISKRAFIDAGLLYPSAAFTLDEISGNRYSWNRTRQLVPTGTTSYSTGKIVSGDFLTLQDAVSYAAANKVSTDDWTFTCYQGDLQTATVAGISTTSTGTLTLQPAVGAEHNGTFDNRQAAGFGGASSYFLTDANAGYLDPGSGDFVVCAWVLLTDKVDATIISKYGNAGQRTWTLLHQQSTNKIIFVYSSDGTAASSVVANTYGTIPTGTWIFVEAGRQSGSCFVAVNRTTRTTSAFSSTFFNSTANFVIGASAASPALNWKGLIDEVYYWSSSGGSTLPTSTDLDAIYNSGAGICKRQFIEQALPTPYDVWSFEFRDGMTTSWGTAAHSLSQSGTVGYDIGHIEEDQSSLVAGLTYLQQDNLIVQHLQFENSIYIYSGTITFDGNLCGDVSINPSNADLAATVSNNLVMIPASHIGIYSAPFVDDGNAYTVAIDLLNNSIISDGTATYGILLTASISTGSVTYSGTLGNNIVLETFSGGCINLDSGNATFNLTSETNIVSDTSGEIQLAVFSSTFTDASNDDFTPLTDGLAWTTATPGLVTYDIEGTLRHNTPDIGAYEGSRAYTTDYVITPSGGLLLAGVGLRSTEFVRTPTGGLVLGGVGLRSTEFVRTPSGGLLLGGAGVLSVLHPYSLTGAIVARFDNDNDSTINALTALVSTCYADEVPAEPVELMPYLVISEVSETPLYDGKDYSYRIESALVQVDCWDVTKDSCDLILEAWEDAYRSETLLLSDSTQIGSPVFTRRMIFEEEQNIWHGSLDVAYMLEMNL